MEQLSLHIEYLLLRHECVILPGFGAFIATGCSARLDIENHRVLPPTREIGFNRAVLTDDGLLAYSIARRNGISFEEGRVALQRAVAQLKEQLIADGEVTLGHVGTLTLGEENTIIFTPRRQKETLAISLGKHSVPMIRRQNDDTIVSPAAEHSVKSTQSPEIGAVAVIGDNNCPPKEIELTKQDAKRAANKYYTLRIRKVYAHVAASLLIIAVAILSYLVPMESSKQSERCLASVVPMERLATNVSTNSSSKESDTSDLMKKDEEGKKIKEETDETEVETLLPYYLIVATFRTAEEAEKFINNSEDSESMVRVERGKLNRVAIAGSSDKSGLQCKLNDTDFKKKYPGAWIWSSR